VVARLGRALREWPPGLPAPPTRLIGRERDLAEVAKLVADSRLVTLVGSGGVGKTRLAIELAATITEDFPDGVNLVDLDGLTDTAQLWRVVAGAVGVAHQAGIHLAVNLCCFRDFFVREKGLRLHHERSMNPRTIGAGFLVNL